MKPIRILAAEDNEADVILFEEALAHHQLEHQLDVVRDGQAAVDYLTRMGKPGQPPCPDLLLLDLNLPKVDGGTILSEFRKHPECRETPVIIVTSSDTERDRVRVGAFPRTRYFRKPSDFEAYMELGAIIREAVGQTAAAETPGE